MSQDVSKAPANGYLYNYDANGNILQSLAAGVTYATLAALKASGTLIDGQFYLVTADGSTWRYVKTNTATTDGDFLVATVAAGGVLIRVDKEVDIQAAVTSATADAAVLYTVPTGFRLQVTVPFWSVSVTFTTGTAGAAGLSSSNAGLSTKGDLLGGATGDLVATLVSTGAYAKGTIGAKAGKPAAVLSAADTIRFDLIAGTYTAGTGIAHIPVRVLLAPAA
jgi:roadblock/LC7 domain-containing protein